MALHARYANLAGELKRRPRETLNKSAGPCASDFRGLPALLAEAGSSGPAYARDLAILQNRLAPVSRCCIQRFPRSVEIATLSNNQARERTADHSDIPAEKVGKRISMRSIRAQPLPDVGRNYWITRFET
jgi:hypothetical protein